MKTLLITFSISILALSHTLEARIFTSKKGQKVDAEIVEVSGDKVKLRATKTSKTYSLPISSLSEADQAYIRKWKPGKAVLEDNYKDSWPSTVYANPGSRIKVVKEDKAKKQFIYHSPNYEFICDVQLADNIVKKFSALFEATREYCRLMPISSMKAHVPGSQFRHKIYLFESKESYIRNGGPPNSAGVFISRGGKDRGIVMAPLTSLGVKRVKDKYVYDFKGNNDVLPHELTHQLTDNAYLAHGADGWFSEGLAEYVAATPYNANRFMVRNNINAIKLHVTGYGKNGKGGRALGKNITAPDLKAYMLQPYSSFAGPNANFNYGLGTLITYYFFHMERDRTNITNFLKALKAGKRGDKALEALRGKRSWDQLEKDIAKAWSAKGVHITFR